MLDWSKHGSDFEKKMDNCIDQVEVQRPADKYVDIQRFSFIGRVQRLIWFENQTGGPKVWLVNKGGKASPLLHFVCRGWQLEGLELYEGGQRCEL